MTPDHLAVLIDLFLKACGVVLLAVIAWRWKTASAAAARRPAEHNRRSTDRPAVRVTRRTSNEFHQEGVGTLEFVQPGTGFRRH
jgi:hypothetical protein